MKLKQISLDSILLFSLVVPFIMTYSLSSGETPYWLFGLIFLSLLCYIGLDLIILKEGLYWRLKQVLLWFVIVAVIGSAFVSAIIARHQTAPVYGVHDIVLQQETAIRFFLDGLNPYDTTYFGTPLEEWHYSDKEVNPALYHFVMEPFYLFFALPFYVIGNIVFGFFDGRMPLLVLFLVLLFLAAVLIRNPKNRLLFLTFLAFNPAMLGYTLEGRSDIFMFAFLFLGFFLLQKEKFLLAGIPLGLAFAVKQSAWPILPLYIAFLYFRVHDITRTIKLLTPFVITFIAIVGPFLLWDAKAFLDSTVFYLSGTAPNSYPISGYGFGMLLREIGVISDIHQYYPFYIWQLVVGIPVLVILVRYIRNVPTVQRLILAYGIFLLVFWYFSRYFNNSHLGYLTMVFITAYFFPEKTDV